jgi:hypothetical protein
MVFAERGLEYAMALLIEPLRFFESNRVKAEYR